MNPETKNSEQHLQNKSFDKEHEIIAIQMVGFDGTNLTRVQVTATGELVVTI
jgi:hypothetical protein